MKKHSTLLAAGDLVEFYPDASRDTTTVKWRPATYVNPHTGLGKGWHLLREPTGNIVSVPGRRVRRVNPR